MLFHSLPRLGLSSRALTSHFHSSLPVRASNDRTQPSPIGAMTWAAPSISMTSGLEYWPSLRSLPGESSDHNTLPVRVSRQTRLGALGFLALSSRSTPLPVRT